MDISTLDAKHKNYEAKRAEFKQLEEARGELERQGRVITDRLLTLAQELGEYERNWLDAMREAADVVAAVEVA